MQTTASLERSDQPDPVHERHGDDSNPAALEKSSQPAQTATHARGSSRWTKLVSRLPWAVASTIVLGFIAVVLWRIYAPSPDVWTDDAYVSVHYATIAPRVPGQVTSVRVDDNDTVKAGQVLAELDDRDFHVALEQAQAQVAAAHASIENIDAQAAGADCRQPGASRAGASGAGLRPTDSAALNQMGAQVSAPLLLSPCHARESVGRRRPPSIITDGAAPANPSPC
jgi:multidrug resistance efflux pump